jgi:adenosylcobinamide-phosphate synthase
MLTTVLLALGAVFMDWLAGEPRYLHPLVGFGWLADRVERYFYPVDTHASGVRRLVGLLALGVLLVPFTSVVAALALLPYLGDLLAFAVLTLAIGHRSLHQHAMSVAYALEQGDEANARRLAGLMVSRDTAQMAVAGATTESVLENGNDGVFAALFWFIIAGAPGCLCYRLVNTLDAMWGYRNQRYQDFGWAAARLDDLLNFIPARLTALSYVVVGASRRAIHCWRTQASAWESPNAGPVMAAGAGALGITLGGPACYGGCWRNRPNLGIGRLPIKDDIARALDLVRAALGLWLTLLLAVALLGYV